MNSETEEVKREGREVERLQQSRTATVHRKEDRGHDTRGEEEDARVGRWVASCLQQSVLLCKDRYGTARASEGAVMHATLWYNQSLSTISGQCSQLMCLMRP